MASARTITTIKFTRLVSSDHTASGLTAGWVLRASGATTFAWSAIQDADLPATIVRTSRTLTAGAGLTGLGDLSVDRTVNVGQGDGISVAADSVAVNGTVARSSWSVNAGAGLSGGGNLSSLGVTLSLTTPGGLSVSSSNTATGSHTHAIASSANPSAASLLASDATGSLQLVNLTLSGNLSVGHIATNLLPAATETYDLGSSTAWWRQQFVSQINATVFAEQTNTLLGGWFTVGKDQGVLPAVTAAQTTINFGKAMTVGHFIVVKAHDASGNIRTEYMQIGSLVSGTTYNVSRDLAGVNSPDPVWASGTPYLVLGTTGSGRIELNAYDTPRLSVIKQGATYNAQTELIRLGRPERYARRISRKLTVSTSAMRVTTSSTTVRL